MLECFADFLERVIRSGLTVLKVLIRSKLKASFRSLENLRSSNKLFVLGNGPSLKDFLEKDISNLKGADTLCVNYFARTKEYTQVKPSHYVIVSPQYWHNKDNPAWKKERDAIFKRIASSTQWDMVLHVPAIALNQNNWRSEIDLNAHIHINYFNTTPVEGIIPINNLIYSYGLGMPRPHNVLVGSLFLSIRMGYEEVYVYGADHSWLKEIFVADDNMVYLSQKHFYDNQVDSSDHYAGSDRKPMYSTDKNEVRKLHEVLHKFTVTFKSYWELERYAREKGISIYNRTRNSFIDAFSRI